MYRQTKNEMTFDKADRIAMAKHKKTLTFFEEAQKALGLESQVLRKEYELLGKAAKKFGDKGYQNPNQIPLSIIESLFPFL